MNLVTPSGFRDVLPEEALAREALTRKVQDFFASQGYAPLETPTLEVMDVLQAAGRMAGSPFKLFDARGDLLAMRSDVTQQVARICASRLAAEQGPWRFRYTQRVFREAEGPLAAKAREMTQMGVECVGEEGPFADAGMVRLLVETLQLCGFTEFTVALATVSVLRGLLEGCGAPLWWQNQVLEAYHASNFVDLKRLCDKGAPGLIPVFAQAILELQSVRGGREAIGRVRELVGPLGCACDVDGFERTYDALVEAGLEDNLLIDFSVMSSFDYYTGIVFEAYAPGFGAALGSGGRYDGMIGAYGRPCAAAGFAFFLEQVMAASALQPCGNGPDEAVTADAAESAETADVTGVPAAERPLRVAVPKGSLNAQAIEALAGAGLDVGELAHPGRLLVVRVPGAAQGDAGGADTCAYPVDYIIVRPSDAPAFVALGAADCGICGKDSLLEADTDVVELADLHFGACRFVVAQPEGSEAAVEEHYRRLGSIRVATKYPRITQAHYAGRGTQVEVVVLHGNIELAPLTGLAERIVDITATGTTLRENNLVIVDEVLDSTARFFANTASLRTDPRVRELARRLSAFADGRSYAPIAGSTV